jgi:hypothetical protein
MVNSTKNFLTICAIIEVALFLLLVVPFGDNLKQKVVIAVDNIPRFAFIKYFVAALFLGFCFLFTSKLYIFDIL